MISLRQHRAEPQWHLAVTSTVRAIINYGQASREGVLCLTDDLTVVSQLRQETLREVVSNRFFFFVSGLLFLPRLLLS